MKKLVLLALLLLVIGSPIFIFFFGGTLGLSTFESDSPRISLTPIADQPMSFRLESTDEGAGLQKILLEVEQAGSTTEISQKTFESLVHSDKIEFSLKSVKGMKEGEALVRVKAWDDSMHENSAEASIKTLVDFKAPIVRIQSLQHVAAQGGAEFVVYQAIDANLAQHGVEVGSHFFPGFPIRDAGYSGEAPADTYASLFALPLGFERKESNLKVVVKDKASNVVSVPLNFRIEPKPQKEATMNLSDDYLNRKNSELFSGYEQRVVQSGNKLPVQNNELPDLAWRFSLINGEYRASLDDQLASIAKYSSNPRLWKETFIKPMPSATSSTFGEKRTYLYDGNKVGTSTHNGLDLASVQMDAVFAANDGVVVLAEEFGIYGNTVVIDHGLGLFSLYGHLSSIGVSKDSKIARGAEIGRTGETGLAGGDHLHFEFRLRDVPITPIEWWDSKWIKDNIDGKLSEIAAPSAL